uniref:sigma-70 family RNA polymerase sigma factor n=1 Tax=Pararhizobium sp. IMCC3301 TaxID=3067904 RepID=UPI0027425001|nr:sigma-70 family RNA polymerase sigma factor [Pararhizobium sp. IMCC3301]
MSEHQLSPEACLERIALQDRAAFGLLYNLISAKLLGVVLRIIPQRSLAEDVLHDTFLKIWRSAHQYDRNRASAMSWTATIARHAAIDHKRRRKELDLPDAQLAMHMDRETLFDRHRDDEATKLTLQHCLAQLEETNRQCIVLAYCQGLSREELSERLNAPVNTIKTWLRRGLLALRECVLQ